MTKPKARTKTTPKTRTPNPTPTLPTNPGTPPRFEPDDLVHDCAADCRRYLANLEDPPTVPATVSQLYRAHLLIRTIQLRLETWDDLL